MFEHLDDGIDMLDTPSWTLVPVMLLDVLFQVSSIVSSHLRRFLVHSVGKERDKRFRRTRRLFDDQPHGILGIFRRDLLGRARELGQRGQDGVDKRVERRSKLFQQIVIHADR